MVGNPHTVPNLDALPIPQASGCLTARNESRIYNIVRAKKNFSVFVKIISRSKICKHGLVFMTPLRKRNGAEGSSSGSKNFCSLKIKSAGSINL